jgi:hypothetical protein
MGSQQMPQPSDARPPAGVMLTQACPKCGQPMHLTVIEPHQHYKNLDSRTFGCDCGETLIVAVARID